MTRPRGSSARDSGLKAGRRDHCAPTDRPRGPPEPGPPLCSGAVRIPRDIGLLVEFVRARISRPSRALVEGAIEARLRAIASRLIEAGQTDDGSEASKLAMSLFGPTGPKRSIPRAKSRRAPTLVAGPDPADPAPAPAKLAGDAPRAVARPPAGRGPWPVPVPGRPPRPALFLGGPRLLGPDDPNRPYGASIDYDPSYSPTTPPWLLTP